MQGILMMPGCAILGAIIGMMVGIPFGHRAAGIAGFAGTVIGLVTAPILGGWSPASSIGMLVGPTILAIWWWKKVT